jgi:glycosyltransferase involved in cell wall biosynthesis
MHEPLISCVMPTSGRKWYVPLAIRYFEAQDYSNKELIIVYDADSDIPPEIVSTSNITLVKSSNSSIGAKRNHGCHFAKGSIIAQWDDDDIYHSGRLSYQAAPIISGTSDITALTDFLFLEHDSGNCWSASSFLLSILFSHQVAGGTLVFRKKIWEQFQYPNISLREDVEFMSRAISMGYQLKKINGKGLFIYRRHTHNTWNWPAPYILGGEGWKIENLPNWATGFAMDDMQNNDTNDKAPFVSCIMPTADRIDFVKKSIHYFLLQDYINRELVIVDDGTESAVNIIPIHPMIRFVRRDHRSNIGAKRNDACSLTAGNIIMHWDDDDWYANDWISIQVSFMQKTNADICGLDKIIFYNEQTDQAWIYEYPTNAPLWVAGATLAYRKKIWENYPFEDVQVGEDNWFVWKSGGKVVAHNHYHGFISFIHSGNTSPKYVNSQRWGKFPVDAVKGILNKSTSG